MKIKSERHIEIKNLPTTIRHLHRLSEELDGPQLYIKRDDTSDLTKENNRLRNLQLFIADARQAQAQIVITFGSLFSSYVYAMVSTAIRYGLKPTIVVTDEQTLTNEYYLMLKKIGVKVIFIHINQDDSKREINRKGFEKVKEIHKKYTEAGMNCYIIPNKMTQIYPKIYDSEEISKQIVMEQLNINYIAKAVDSTCSFAFSILENKLLNTALTPIGISVVNKADIQRQKIVDSVIKLGIHLDIESEEINLFNSLDNNYGTSIKAGVKAIKLLAEKEAIFLDHYYNGQALAGLFYLIRQGHFNKEDGVLFLHTGNTPALFAMGNDRM